MKIPDRIRGWHLLLAALPLLFLSGWSGKAMGRRNADRHAGQVRESPEMPEMPPRASVARSSPQESTDAPQKARRLLLLWRASPNADFDFELAGEVDRLLAGLSSEEIAEIFRELGGTSNSPWDLRREILDAWAVKDGAAALGALDDNPVDQFIAVGMFRNWMLERPEDAVGWLSTGDVPAHLRERAGVLRLNSLRSIVETDPDFAFRQIPLMDRAEAVRNLRHWATCFPERADLRERAVKEAEALATPEELAALRKALALAWAGKDPAAATDYAASLDFTESDRLQLDADILMNRPGATPGDALDEWMSGHADVAEVPRPVIEKVSTWMFQKPEEAEQWLGSLPPGPLRDRIDEKAAWHFIGLGKPAKAAELLERIESPESRSAALRKLDRLWPDLDPQAATAWREGLSADDRSLLEEAR